METEASSPPSSLRHRLRATVCCCFGFAGGAGDWAQWRRRAGVGEFRYDPLSYALNFDEGADDDDVGDGDGDGGLLYRSYSSPPRNRARTSTPAVVAVA